MAPGQGSSVLAFVLMGALVGGCTGPSNSVRIQAELVRLPGPTGAAPAPSTGPASSTVVRPWSSLLSITSLQGPIMGVLLEGPGLETIEVYNCPGSLADNCLVDLAGPALQNLLNTAPIVVRPGTYDRITIEYCRGEMRYHTYLAGTVSIGGTTYFTRAAGNLGTVGPAEQVSLPYEGCSDEFAISPPLVVADTVSIPIVLRLNFDIRDIGYAALGDPTTNQVFGFGCSPVATLGVTPFACAAYPSVAALEGTVPPVVERYRVNGGATIGLLFDPSTDRFIGGYFRLYVVEDQAWNPRFTPAAIVLSLTDNGGGSYTLRQAGSGPAGTGPGGATFPAFQRSTHSGTATNGEGASFGYTAVRLP